MDRSLRRLFPLFLVVGLFAASARPALGESEINQRLRDHYQGKTLLLRGFYSGSSLRYDKSGTPAEGTPRGDWTLDGVVQIQNIGVAGDRLKIHATRLHLGWLRGGLQPLHDQVGRDPLREEKENRELRIEAALGSDSDASADSALSRIFLTSNDSFAELLPDYWKPCVLAGLMHQMEGNKESCRFSQEFLAIPGVAPSSDLKPPETSDADSRQKSALRLSRIGGDITPPKVLNQHEPEFTDAARRAKFQGVVTFKLVVDASGIPTNIRILSPLGCGLDAQGVRTLETWRFTPSEKDGVPVPVEIAVEVNFHLY
jgi:TonB family protein